MNLLKMLAKIVPPLSLILTLVIGLTCSPNKDDKLIYYYKNCGDVESNSDLLNSIKKVKGLFNKNNILIKKGKDDRKCGYKFTVKEREEFIEGTMTDIELILMSEEFFDLKILRE